MSKLSNWAGTFSFTPKVVIEPQTVEQFQFAIASARKNRHTLRPRGSRHSWNPLIATDSVSVSMDAWSGVDEVIGDEAWVRSGTKISALGDLLFPHHLSLANQGDIDSQSISGAISTGTHGTGIDLGIISSQVTGVRLLNGKGEVKEFLKERDGDLFNAIPVSFGFLGIILAYRIKCIPSYVLHCKTGKISWECFLAEWVENNSRNRHYEGFWFPYTDEVLTKTTNIDPSGARRPLKGTFITHGLIENFAWGALSEIARFSQKTAKFSAQTATKLFSAEDFSDWSFRAFPSYRWIKFQEMEYGLPYESSGEILREVRKLIEKHQYHVHFPIEIRSTAADDLWLSPAYQRKTIFIAVHMYKKMEYQAYFQDLENLFLSFGGRPHWGKTHTQDFSGLQKSYEKIGAYRALSETMDPEKIFRNPIAKKWFGLDSQSAKLNS